MQAEARELHTGSLVLRLTVLHSMIMTIIICNFNLVTTKYIEPNNLTGDHCGQSFCCLVFRIELFKVIQEDDVPLDNCIFFRQRPSNEKFMAIAGCFRFRLR